MKRTSRNFQPSVIDRWRAVTDSLGYGPRGMVKLLLFMLDYAEAHPDLFRRRP